MLVPIILRRALVAFSVVACATAVLQLADPSPAEAARRCAPTAANRARAEAQFRNHINRTRSVHHQQRLRGNARLATVARRWSVRMSQSDRLAHNPNYTRQIRALSWSRAAENVGYRRAPGEGCRILVRRLHAAFMRSAGHRDNIHGRHNRVGVGVRIDRDGTMWVTENFIHLRR